MLMNGFRGRMHTQEKDISTREQVPDFAGKAVRESAALGLIDESTTLNGPVKRGAAAELIRSQVRQCQTTRPTLPEKLFPAQKCLTLAAAVLFLINLILTAVLIVLTAVQAPRTDVPLAELETDFDLLLLSEMEGDGSWTPSEDVQLPISGQIIRQNYVTVVWAPDRSAPLQYSVDQTGTGTSGNSQLNMTYYFSENAQAAQRQLESLLADHSEWIQADRYDSGPFQQVEVPSAEEFLVHTVGVDPEDDVEPYWVVLARKGDRTLELFLAPFSDQASGGVLVVLHDVTEQHRNEERRKEFVANVSHELRTPLTNIRSYAETLADNAGDIPPETEKNFLGVILNESDRMTHIVQDLLTLSRFDSGRSELNLAPFDFGEAVRDVYQANRLEAQRHGHTMELELPGSLPEIVGDRERILQVMMNVVSNSIKYTPDGGRIRLSAGVQGKRVWMEVTDNGIGIPKEDRGRIFERFYRVDKARSRESGGTGLGLSIAKEIIDRHQGTIELVDRPGPGLTVRITLLVEGPGHGWK